MAFLKQIFENAIVTAFKVFEESVVTGTYTQPSSTDDGFTVVPGSNTPFEGIITKFEQKDIQTLSFGNRVQPTDLKCLIPGSFISSLEITTQDTLTVTSDFEGNVLNDKYSVIAFDVDPYQVLYILLLRNA